MVALNTIKSTSGARKTSKRLGRGNGSGKWTFSGRWCKWQNARAGGWVPDWFEWGQTPLFRRMPKLKGFSNALFKKEYNVVNVSDIDALAAKWVTKIDKEVLLENKIIRKKWLGVKLLGNGEIKAKVTVSVDKASASAKESIEKAWGELILK